MNKKYLLVLLLFPICAGSSYVVKDGNKEIGSLVTHDGSSEKEVVSERELEKDSRGYTRAEEPHIQPTEVNGVEKGPDNSLEGPPQPVRGNYGIIEGMRELEVERIASRENMGFPSKTTEYIAGDTYAASTWIYEYESPGVKHNFKVYFDADGKVLRVNHQTEKV